MASKWWVIFHWFDQYVLHRSTAVISATTGLLIACPYPPVVTHLLWTMTWIPLSDQWGLQLTRNSRVSEWSDQPPKRSILMLSKKLSKDPLTSGNQYVHDFMNCMLYYDSHWWDHRVSSVTDFTNCMLLWLWLWSCWWDHHVRSVWTCSSISNQSISCCCRTVFFAKCDSYSFDSGGCTLFSLAHLKHSRVPCGEKPVASQELYYGLRKVDCCSNSGQNDIIEQYRTVCQMRASKQRLKRVLERKQCRQKLTFTVPTSSLVERRSYPVESVSRRNLEGYDHMVMFAILQCTCIKLGSSIHKASTETHYKSELWRERLSGSIFCCGVSPHPSSPSQLDSFSLSAKTSNP